MQDNIERQYLGGFGAPNTTEVSEVKPVLSEGDEIIDMGADFDFGDFQVVKREFFAHLREPSETQAGHMQAIFRKDIYTHGVESGF